jgi:RAB protein geranylgeranyltransferase component A
VPATDMEAASTSLVGFFEKRRLRNFIIYVQEYEQNDAKVLSLLLSLLGLLLQKDNY